MRITEEDIIRSCVKKETSSYVVPWGATSVDHIPKICTRFYCNTNIPFIPTLHEEITVLDFNSSEIRYLPELPPKLTDLMVAGCGIVNLDNIPDSVQYLDVRVTNRIVKPLKLPKSLTTLIFNDNVVIEELPPSIKSVRYRGNNPIIRTMIKMSGNSDWWYGDMELIILPLN